jgi:Domain of unknown function (DUF4190)
MKRCPTCNQTFSEEWLSFCTQDGTALVDTSALPQEPPPTVMGPPLPPSVSPTEQPTLNLPGSYSPPPVPFSQPSNQSAPVPSWQPPPPPSYVAAPQQTMAIWSLVCGVFSITIGFCCYVGVVSAPVAIILGIMSLNQIKNDPSKYTGRGLAIGGIVTGALYFAGVAVIILIYGLAFLAQGIK